VHDKARSGQTFLLVFADVAATDIPTIDGWCEAYESLRKRNSDRGIIAEIKKIVEKIRK
jgi:hypothetical protein